MPRPAPVMNHTFLLLTTSPFSHRPAARAACRAAGAVDQWIMRSIMRSQNHVRIMIVAFAYLDHISCAIDRYGRAGNFAIDVTKREA